MPASAAPTGDMPPKPVNARRASQAPALTGLDLNVWQVDNALWNARYRNPYLVLTAGPPAGTIYCEYDILNAAASAPDVTAGAR